MLARGGRIQVFCTGSGGRNGRKGRCKEERDGESGIASEAGKGERGKEDEGSAGILAGEEERGAAGYTCAGSAEILVIFLFILFILFNFIMDAEPVVEEVRRGVK